MKYVAALFLTLASAGLGIPQLWAAEHRVRPGDDVPGLVPALSAGDTMVFAEGTYRLSRAIDVAQSGTAAARITLRAEPGKAVVIDASAGPNAPGVGSAFIISGDYITVEGFEIRNSHWQGINVYGGRWAILRNNKIHGHVQAGVYLGAANGKRPIGTVIEGNEVYDVVRDNLARTNNAGGWASGITATEENTTVRGNHVYRNYGEGIVISEPGNVVVGNIVHDNFSVNIYAANAQNAVIEKNFIYCTPGEMGYTRQGAPAVAIQLSDETTQMFSKAIIVRNNIAVHCKSAFYFWSGIGGGLVDTIIANNTFYSSYSGTGSMVHIDAAGHRNARFVNNIFVQTVMRPMVYMPSGSGITWDHNLWSGGTGPIPAAVGQDDVRADPKIAMPGALEPAAYRLQPSSPAAGAGTGIAAVTDDFGGGGRPGSDIGAWSASAMAPPQGGNSGSGGGNASGGQGGGPLGGAGGSAGAIAGESGGDTSGSAGRSNGEGESGGQSGSEDDADDRTQGSCSCRLGGRPRRAPILPLATLCLGLLVLRAGFGKRRK